MAARIILILFSALMASCRSSDDTSTEAAATDTLQPAVDSAAIIRKAKILDSLFLSFYEQRGFNGVVLVAQGGNIIYQNAFGYADLKTKDTLTVNSVFQLASVSKQFTAAAIMLLKERGQLSYDDSIEKYLKGFPYKGITIRQLLTHRSGLPNYMYFSEEFCAGKDTMLSYNDVICIMEEHKPAPYYKPDTKFNYCNTNYILLAAIVERVSGKPFGEFAAKEIFNPLEMNSTFVSDRNSPLNNSNICTGYYSLKRKAEDNYLDGVVGDKEVFSTLEDLYKWDQALYAGKLLRQETLEEAWTPASKEKKNGHNYGFGWRLWDLPDSTRVVYHNGWWHGYNTNFIRVPEDTITLIVLRNVSNKSFHFYDVPEVLKALKPEKYSAMFIAAEMEADSSFTTE